LLLAADNVSESGYPKMLINELSSEILLFAPQDHYLRKNFYSTFGNIEKIYSPLHPQQSNNVQQIKEHINGNRFSLLGDSAGRGTYFAMSN